MKNNLKICTRKILNLTINLVIDCCVDNIILISDASAGGRHYDGN